METQEKLESQAVQASDTADSTIISTKDPASMTEEERQQEATRLAERLKALRSVPRSDWHRGFEDLLQVEISEWGVKYKIDHEVTLGEDAPRIDFLVLTLNGLPDKIKTAFKHFRKQNVIEYKRPGDSVNRHTIRKVNGYADFHIGLAEHEDDVPEGDVSVTIFTYSKNKRLFAELEAEGILTDKDENGLSTKGIYYVKKITDLPYAIIVVDELEGDAYAAFRALSDHAREDDVEFVMQAGKAEKNPEKKDRYVRLLNLIGFKNPELFEELLRRHSEMEDYLMNLLQPRINERVNDATRTIYFTLVQKGKMTLDDAADEANMSPSDFSTAMTNAGYKLPQTV